MLGQILRKEGQRGLLGMGGDFLSVALAGIVEESMARAAVYVDLVGRPFFSSASLR